MFPLRMKRGPKMRHHKAILVIACLAVLTASGAVFYRKVLWWKRFAVVEPGVLYRSGILRDWQLRRAIEKYNIKTVFALTYTNNAGEQRVCDEMGVRRHFVYLAGDGVGPDDPYLRFLQIAQNPENHPILVHCSAGVQRTGGAVALYRILFQDWDFDRAIQEMIAMGNDGKQDQIDQLRRIEQKLSHAVVADAQTLRNSWNR